MGENNRNMPISRMRMWTDELEYQYHIELAREAIEEYSDFRVILYQVDREKSEFDDIYKESTKNGIRFRHPVELRVRLGIMDSDNKAYTESIGAARQLEDGNLVFTVFEDQLKELKVDIRYGDYIALPVDEHTLRYFSVSNDGIKNYSSGKLMLGYKPAFRIIECTPVDEDEFKGK